MTSKLCTRARWMLAGGLMLIVVQFLLQYVGGYRQMARSVLSQEGWSFMVFSCAIFCIIGIDYYASCFHRHMAHQNPECEEEAEACQECDETETVLSEEDWLRVEQAAKKWVEQGGYLKPNQTLSTVANDMDVQRYMLKAWLHHTEHGRLANWLNHLRIEEAQRVMAAHPDWGMDAVADHCGLSRSSFHRIFRLQVGMTPAKYQEKI